MGVLEQVMQLRRQGAEDKEIVKTLQAQGIQAAFWGDSQALRGCHEDLLQQGQDAGVQDRIKLESPAEGVRPPA